MCVFILLDLFLNKELTLNEGKMTRRSSDKHVVISRNANTVTGTIREKLHRLM